MTHHRPHRATALVPTLLALGAVLMASGCAHHTADPPETNPGLATVAPASADWGALNPARGSAGPRAANLWGDRAGSGATGFLVRFADGFSSPPHIHNVTYRGIVIEGLIHNDDPDAEPSWMAPGSYWTQPAGEVHITAAKGDGRLAYIEIQRGPYLVMPPEEATDNGERAINVHADNMVWLDASTTSRVTVPEHLAPSSGPRVTFLWGDPQDDHPGGALLAVPAGATITLHSADPEARVVVVKGTPMLHDPTSAAPAALEPGSLVESPGPIEFRCTLSSPNETWLYVRTAGHFEAAQHPAN
ncbi:MAG: DUF4437 domain-containing protein [Phycisphaerales bacterium]